MYCNQKKIFHALFAKKVLIAICIFYMIQGSASAATARSDGDSTPESVEAPEASRTPATYELNLKQQQLPLLSLPAQISSAADLALTYPMGQLRFPLFQSLEFDQSSNRYVLRLIANDSGRGRTVVLKQSDSAGRYASLESSDVFLIDSKGVKAIHMSDGTEYTFVRFTDGVNRCIRVRTAAGSLITLVYAKDNLIHGLVDSLSRAIRFNYQDQELTSVTQTWMVNAVAFSKTWPIGRATNQIREQVKLARAGAPGDQVKLAHAGSAPPTVARFSKPIPNNALTTQYTTTMAGKDRQLAAIFGDPGAVAAANSYEPPALAQQYPLYRGDLIANDGRVIRGHLSYAMHLYGNAEGTGASVLYVPAGFTSHSSEPGPTDAAVTFYYPRLGNLTDVTLAVFHVANFGISYEHGCPSSLDRGLVRLTSGKRSSEVERSCEASRVRIGSLGGPGGSNAAYKHTHIEFYRGNTGLPSASAREHLRIDPATVFAPNSLATTRTRTATARRSD